jgi:hypothetical protein
VGEEVRITLRQPAGGRKNFQGKLLSADDNTISVEVDGTHHRLPRDEVASARLVPNWDDVMGGKSSWRERVPYDTGVTDAKR